MSHFRIILITSVSTLVTASRSIFLRLECSCLRILGTTSWMRNLSLLPELVDFFHRGHKCANMSRLIVRLGGHCLVLANVHDLWSNLFPQIIVFVLLITLLRIVSYLVHLWVTNSCPRPPWCPIGFNVILFVSSLSAAITASLDFASSVTTLLWVLPSAYIILLCWRLFRCDIKDEFFGCGWIIIVIHFSFLCNLSWSKFKTLILCCLFASHKFS